MYARRKTRPKPRKSQAYKFSAPVAGWISNRALSDSKSIEGPGAAILDNFFPKASSVKLRRGKQRYATLFDETIPVLSIFSYVNGTNQKLFAANATTIYDITSVLFPYGWEIVTDEEALIVTETGDWFGVESTLGLEVYENLTGGNWVTAQFATSGGVYLIGVNGQDTGFIFDGTGFYPFVSGGVSSLGIDGIAGDFLPGETITGGTSGATAIIYKMESTGASTATLYLTNVSGTFVDNETVTSSGTGSGSADGVTSLIIPGVDFSGGLTSADMSYVWVYKNRLWFAQKDSMTAWYLAIDSIAGAADFFPLGGVFGRGGSLLFGAAWSLDGTADAGLSEQCIFVSSEGEVAVYQGTSPEEASTWSKVGTYRIGRPLGPRAHFRGGGDIAIATSAGLVPLSKAVNLDVTSLAVATVSYKIADAWSDATSLRGMEDWQCEIWPEQKMAIVSPPAMIGGGDPVLFVSNTETGAWGRFTNWQARCLEVFQGQLYFGGDGGRIWIGNTSGTDDGEVYTGEVVPLFDDLGSPASAKVGQVARAVTRSNAHLNGVVRMRSDYDEQHFQAPDAPALVAANAWGTGIWGQSTWGSTMPTVINQNWQSVGGVGYAVSVGYQVSSGALVPLDDELIRIDFTYTTAEVVT